MVQYHFKVSDGPDMGPMGVEEFRQRQEAGEITDTTMVWRSGMVDWCTYASMVASDERAAQPKVKAPVAKAVKGAAKTADVDDPRFQKCAECGQAWPPNLLTLQEGKQICGNCQRSRAEAAKRGGKKRIPGSGVSLIKWMVLLVVCAGSLFAKIWTHRNDPKVTKVPGQVVKAPAR